PWPAGPRPKVPTDSSLIGKPKTARASTDYRRSNPETPVYFDSQCHPLFQVQHFVAGLCVGLHPVSHHAAGVQYRAVIAPAKGFANGVQRTVGHLTRQVHGDLTGKSDVLRASFAGHISHSDIEMFRDFLLNEFDADGGAAFFMEDFPKKVFNDLSREFFSCEGSVGGNAKQGTL